MDTSSLPVRHSEPLHHTEFLPWARFLRWAILVVFGGCMAWISWLKWPDLIVDFGQQAYVPWRLSEGEVLYRDIFYIYGPLSAYVHALLFKLFGSSLLTLAWFNLGLVACFTVLLYALFGKFSDGTTACLTGLTFLAAFAFGQYHLGGNYNFITAYVYELPHGVFLSILTLYVFIRRLDRAEPGHFFLPGALTGLVFLTKPEVFISLAAALGTGFGLIFILKHRKRSPRIFIAFFAGAFLPALLFTGYLSLDMPVSEAARAIAGPYIFITQTKLTQLPLYRWTMGLDQPVHNLVRMVLPALALAVGLGAIYGINKAFNARIRQYPLGFILAGCSLSAYGLLAATHLPWTEVLRPLPLFMMALAVDLARRIYKNKKEYDPRLCGQLVLVVFALVLLLKIALNTHISHYGFALALPATLITVWFLVYELPARLKGALGSTVFYRSLMITFVLVFSVYHSWQSHLFYNLKNYPVTGAQDMVLDYDSKYEPRGAIVNAALKYIEQNISPDSGFATFPDGIMINFLARRKSPVPDITLNPGVWTLVGDAAVIQRLEQASPPYIVYIDRKFPYFGMDLWGTDFAAGISEWITRHYTPVARFGETPFKKEGFGIQILKRNRS